MFVGLLIKLFFATSTTKDGSTGQQRLLYGGYGVSAASVIGIMFVSFAMTQHMDKISNNSLQFVMSIFSQSIVPLLTLGILVWLITINSIFYKRINQGEGCSRILYLQWRIYIFIDNTNRYAIQIHN